MNNALMTIGTAGGHHLPHQAKVKTKAPALADAQEWSHTLLAGEAVNYTKALIAIASLGAGWRMPTSAELLSLVDANRTAPCIDTSKFPDTRSRFYWTSTPCIWDPAARVVIGFYCGTVDSHTETNINCVRAIRDVVAKTTTTEVTP